MTTLPESGSRLANLKFSLPGLFWMAVAGGLALVLVKFTAFTAEWPVTAHYAAWVIVGILTIVGVYQNIDTWRQNPHAQRVSAFNQHRVNVPREGIVYMLIMIVLFIGSLLGNSNMLMLVFAIMAGPFVFNGWVTFGMLQGSQVTRTAPVRAMEGELFSVDINCRNVRSLLSAWILLVRDELRHTQETIHPFVLFTRVPPNSTQTGHYSLRLAHRGRYVFGPLYASSRYPLGFIERGRLFDAPGEVLVYPRIGRLAPAWKRQLMGATELVTHPQSTSGMFDDEFHNLREYRPGDNVRSIHWRTSARRNELILREYHENREHNLAIVLDLWFPQYPQPSHRKRVEWALRLAATLALEHRRECREAELGLSASGLTTVRWEGQASAAALESLFDTLAVLEGGPAQDTATLLAEATALSNVTHRIVLITTRENPHEALPAGQVSSRLQTIIADPEMLQSLLIFEDDLPAGTAPALPPAPAVAGV